MLNPNRFLVLFGLGALILLPFACSSNNTAATPSAPVTIYYVPVTPTPSGPHPYLAQWGSVGATNGTFQSPIGIAVNSAGTTVWVADTGNNRIQYFTGTGGYLGQWGSTGTTDGNFKNPTGLAVNSGGTTLYVTDDYNHRVQYFSSTGTYLGQWGTTGISDGQFQDPIGIGVNSTGTTVYVADTSNGNVQYFSGTGTYLGQWTPPAGGFLTGLAFDETSNKVFVASRGLDFVAIFNGTGTSVGSIGTSSGSGNYQFIDPYMISTNGNYLYVPDSGNNRVKIHQLDGSYVGQFTGSGSGYNFNTPQGVAADASNNVYIVDTNNNRIVKFGP